MGIFQFLPFSSDRMDSNGKTEARRLHLQDPGIIRCRPVEGQPALTLAFSKPSTQQLGNLILDLGAGVSLLLTLFQKISSSQRFLGFEKGKEDMSTEHRESAVF